MVKETKENVEEEIKPESVEKPAEEMVQMTKTSFEEFKKQMDDMKKIQDMLLQAADKRALAQYYQRNQQDAPKRMKLRTWTVDGIEKVVVGWKQIDNTGSFKNQMGAWNERLIKKIFLEDKTTVDVDETTFNQGFKSVMCKQVGMIVENGQTIFKLIREDNGKEYTVDVHFIN